MKSSLFSRLQNVASASSGAVFLGAGTFKLFVPFGNYLAMMNVPLPQIAGIGVALLEIGGGATLLFHRRARGISTPKIRENSVRLASFALAIDMIFAILLVGIPGKRGKTHTFETHVVGAEAWRLPLEIFLLLSMICFTFRPPNAEK